MEFDERIKARLAREREKWEKESDTEDLKAQLQAKDEEISQIRREHYRADVRRAVIDELGAPGSPRRGAKSASSGTSTSSDEPAEDGSPYFGSVRRQLADVSKDMPELLKYELGAGSGIGSKTPVLTQEKPLTREEVESMSEAEINTRLGPGEGVPGRRAQLERGRRCPWDGGL